MGSLAIKGDGTQKNTHIVILYRWMWKDINSSIRRPRWNNLKPKVPITWARGKVHDDRLEVRLLLQ